MSSLTREDSTTIDNLIVDFPTLPRAQERRRSSISCASNPQSSSTRGHRGVHFSTQNDLVHIDRPSTEDITNSWYSAKDKRRFKKVLIHDVKRLTNVLSSSVCDDNISTDDLNACVGIEIFLSQGLAKRARDKRTMHSDAILLEQLRQDEKNIQDDHMIRRVSERSSQWSRDRSYDLAVGYWEILNDGGD